MCFDGTAMVQHPLVAAGGGAVYILGRVAYFLGYKTGNPENRKICAPLTIPGLLTLIGTCTKIGCSWAVGKK